MSIVQGEHTFIDQLRIRGEPGHCVRVQRELALLQWPEPSDGAWVFVRSLQVQTSVQQAAMRIRRAAADCVNQTADSENVKRFASLEALLTSLITDLCTGQAAGKWYWQRWSFLFNRSISSALSTLLSEHAQLVMAVVHRLDRHGMTALFWDQLQDSDARQLLLEIAYQGHYPAPDLEPDRLPTTPLVSARIPTYLHTIAANLRALPQASSRRHLLLWLVAQQVAPLALKQATAETLGWTETQLFPLSPDGHGASFHGVDTGATPRAPGSTTEADPHPAHNDQPGKSQVIRTPPATPAEQPWPGPTNEPPASTPSSGNLAEPARDEARPGALDTIEQTGQRGDAGHPQASQSAEVRPGNREQAAAGSRTGSVLEEPASPSIITADAPDHSTPFFSRQGGMLYLLNVLNRPEMQSIMGDHWAVYPSGWFWCVRLAQLLDVDLSDPLMQWMLLEMGVDAAHPFSDVPPLPEARRIQLWLHQTYDVETVWNSDLLTLPARIHTSPSHVDLYAPLSAVRLDVRLAGLDINPGWLPWLGRVVTFHFREAI